MKLLVGKLKEEIADESHPRETLQRMSTIRLQKKRERSIGRRGGSLQYPAHIVMLICELLVNGNPPSDIPDKIQTISTALNGSEVNEIPSLDYVRECHVVVQNLNDMLAACRLVKAYNWNQIFTDGTNRGQITFKNLVIGFMMDGDFESVIASLCISLENETPEKLVKAVKNKVPC